MFNKVLFIFLIFFFSLTLPNFLISFLQLDCLFFSRILTPPYVNFCTLLLSRFFYFNFYIFLTFFKFSCFNSYISLHLSSYHIFFLIPIFLTLIFSLLPLKFSHFNFPNFTPQIFSL